MVAMNMHENKFLFSALVFGRCILNSCAVISFLMLQIDFCSRMSFSLFCMLKFKSTFFCKVHSLALFN